MKKRRIMSVVLAVMLSISLSLTSVAAEVPVDGEETDKQETLEKEDLSEEAQIGELSDPESTNEDEQLGSGQEPELKSEMKLEMYANQTEEEIAISPENFPDEAFRNYIMESFDKDNNGQLSKQEIQSATKIDFEYGTVEVTDLTGLQYFVNLEEFYCSMSFNGITTLDVSSNTLLRILDCSYNEKLESVNVSKCVNLEQLHCYESSIKTLDVLNNRKLVRLDCNHTLVNSLDVTKCPELFALNCEDTSVSTLDLSKNPKLYEVYVTNDTGFTELDVSHNPELTHLRIGGTSITNIDTSHNPKLAALYMENTDIKSIDISKNPEMFEIFCHDSKLEALDVSGMKHLSTLECYNTPIKKIDVRASKNLAGLQIQNTQISELDISNNTKLSRLEVQDTKIKTLDISKCKELRYLNISNTSISNLKKLDMSSYKKLEELYCANAGIETLNVGTASLSGLDCTGNAIAGLDLSRLGEGDENYWGAYLGISASSQERSVSCSIDKDRKLQFVDLKKLVPDISKVTMDEGEGYSYDSKTGIITLTQEGDATVSYVYELENENVSSPMNVKLNIHYHSNIVNDSEVKASFAKEGKTAGTHCSVCGEMIEIQNTIPKVTAVLSSNLRVYSGKKMLPAVVVKSGNKTLVNGTDYTVKYTGGFKKVGKYNIVVNLKGAEYSGNTTLKYQVVPKGTKISKVKKAKKALTVTWKKQKNQTSGYQVQYSLKKNFSSRTKSKLIKKNKVTHIKLKNLKAKKTYYVRIRTYKTVKVNGKNTKIYSKWSGIKKCRTK